MYIEVTNIVLVTTNHHLIKKLTFSFVTVLRAGSL